MNIRSSDKWLRLRNEIVVEYSQSVVYCDVDGKQLTPLTKMKILDYYLVPKHARAKAWKWCLSHLPEDYVARHGRKLMVVARNGMTNAVVRDEFRVRFDPSFRCWFRPGDYGVRWERTF